MLGLACRTESEADYLSCVRVIAMAYKKEAKLCLRNSSCSAVHIRLSSPLNNSSHSETNDMGSFSKLVRVCVLTASLKIQALHINIR